MTRLRDYEFRPVTSDEMKEVHQLVRYVFADNETSTDKEIEEDPLKPEMTTGAFYKGKLVAISGGLPFTMSFNGRKISADGVTAVGTDPGHRRRGLVRHMITQRLQLAHKNGIPAAVLWASMGAIYQRFGYGLSSYGYRCKVDPRLVEFQFAGERDNGVVVRESRETAWPLIQKIYQDYCTPRTLTVDRSPELWKMNFPERGSPSYFAIRYDESGNPDGYVVYGTRTVPIEVDGPNQRLSVDEFVHLNTSAYRALWEYMCSHDLVNEIRVHLPVDDPAHFMLLDPRSLRAQWEEGIWMRVVDVERLAADRPYSRAGSVSFEIAQDADCPWNVGTYRIESDGNDCEVQRVQQSADFRISINGLATLLSGCAPLSALCVAGRAELLNQSREAELDHFFSTTYKPFCNVDF